MDDIRWFRNNGVWISASIGVQIANPKSLVICVAGEASFLMNIQELSTDKTI